MNVCLKPLIVNREQLPFKTWRTLNADSVGICQATPDKNGTNNRNWLVCFLSCAQERKVFKQFPAQSLKVQVQSSYSDGISGTIQAEFELRNSH